MTDSEKQVVGLLRYALGTSKYPLITDFDTIWRIACNHHLEVLIYEIIRNDRNIPVDLLSSVYNTYNKMVGRYVQQIHCQKIIEDTFRLNNIPFALLKGAILRDDYLDPTMRFMGDLDFYIRPEDRCKIRELMRSIKGVFRGTESGDEQFVFWNQIGIEFHGRLLYKYKKSSIINYPAWEYVDTTKNRLTEEGFALNLLGHAVHDLNCGGPGVRYILDIWIYRHRHHPQPDWNRVDEVMKADGIYKAAHNLIMLSEYLFSNSDCYLPHGQHKMCCNQSGHHMNDGRKVFEIKSTRKSLMNEMASYVLQGGLHGDIGRSMTSKASKGNAILREFFRSRIEFENRYPWVKKCPILLPVAWVLRSIDSIRRHKGFLINWIRGIVKVSEADARYQQERLHRFGL